MERLGRVSRPYLGAPEVLVVLVVLRVLRVPVVLVLSSTTSSTSSPGTSASGEVAASESAGVLRLGYSRTTTTTRLALDV